MTIDANAATIIVALIAALGSIATTVITIANKGRLDVIHVLVNSNLAKIKQDLVEALLAKDVADLEIERLKAHAAAALVEKPS